ncbi:MULTISPECIES: glycosyltransferase family 4 protein [unclassified Pantoea]|uniref:glycosyltransferase family 4 protein n=1 Tax=unclassified Pantoea TaxID=2630326 RepID=UPI001CD4D87A|nr:MULTISPECIES: glycosyltransferase family 1 protein [unclassified Pantoea]MCA1176227.1 glycosyltransferase family 4 protein [Pantoea sp. alder69]MCA1249197.1 glycosyltransferase family 4 protein [Pantoea sp. alder70]MCA1264728.1 glycosyltransferase family 4 protein [Pantoea sp. alder81]
MKVILSVEPIKYPLTGIGRYTYELARAIEKTNEIEHLLYFDGKKIVQNIPGENSSVTVSHGLKNILKNNSAAIKIYQTLSPKIKKRVLSRYGDYIYHGPNFFLPEHKAKKVSTFHDLSPFKYPYFFEPKRCKYTQQEILKGLKRSDFIITVSDYIKKELSEHFDYPSDRIKTTHLAASDNFFPRNELQTLPVLKKYNLNYQGYSLFIGTIEPRKNIVSLIDAYESMPAELRLSYPLVISGFKGWRNEQILFRIEKAQREGWLIYLGYIPNSDIPLLYSAAKVFCFPSNYEGFGLPVLEALQSGVPVVCSNNSSLTEVAGENSLFHESGDVEGIRSQLEIALCSVEHRNHAIEQGITHAKRFSWEKCAQQTMDVYKELNHL